MTAQRAPGAIVEDSTGKSTPGAWVDTSFDPSAWPAPTTPVTGSSHVLGSIDCSANPNYPVAVQGDIYKVSVAGRLGGGAGAQVDVGDMAFAMADNAGGDQATVGSSWNIVEHNLVGALLAANNLSDVANVATALSNLGGQPLDADLTSWAAITRAAGFDAFVAAANSANLRALLTDETGAGAAVFADSPTLTGTPAAPTAAAATNTTQLATTAFVQAAVSSAVAGLLNFKGATDCSANPNYPSAAKGDAYIVSVAGKIGGASGTSVDVGDWYVATAANAGGTEAGVGTSWGHMEHNLVGALLASNNLSDLASAATARTNLGVPAGSGNSTGTNTGDETGARIATLHHAASVKSALVDADEVTGGDSAASFGLIRTTWTSVKAFLKTYFDTIYQAIGTSGSFTGTTTGHTVAQTGTITWRIVNGQVFLTIPQLSGTSNATTFTITGAPAAIFPAATRVMNGPVQDNGGAVVMGQIQVGTGGVISLFATLGAGAFTNVGTKACTGMQLTYPL